jgi:hypothetical protein
VRLRRLLALYIPFQIFKRGISDTRKGFERI